MKFVPTDVEGCTLVETDRYLDQRGFFQELYEEDKFSSLTQRWIPAWRQANWSCSKKNALRGIHVAEYEKLITCVSGKIWDLIVDLRSKSPTFLKYVGIELSADEPRQILIPAGCGHGFVALEDNSAVVYFQTALYAQKGELTVMYDEPVLNIPWPGESHIISDRDKNGQPLWSYQCCVETEMNWRQNDEFQAIWVASLNPEDKAAWLMKNIR